MPERGEVILGGVERSCIVSDRHLETVARKFFCHFDDVFCVVVIAVGDRVVEQLVEHQQESAPYLAAELVSPRKRVEGIVHSADLLQPISDRQFKPARIDGLCPLDADGRCDENHCEPNPEWVKAVQVGGSPRRLMPASRREKKGHSAHRVRDVAAQSSNLAGSHV